MVSTLNCNGVIFWNDCKSSGCLYDLIPDGTFVSL